MRHRSSRQEPWRGAPVIEPTSARVARVLFRRNFWPYFAGNLLSNSGTWFQNIAQVLLVSPFLVGVVNFAQFAAVIVLAPVAGSAADRFDRRRLVVATQLAAAALAGVLAVVTATGRATPAIVIAVALALGVTTAVATPALQAVVPSLVTRAELPAAVALNAVTFNLARALGPIAGVFVIAQYDIPTAFAVNALSYLALVAGMFLVSARVDRPTPSRRPRLWESVGVVRADRALLLPLIVVGLVSLTADPVNTLSPAFATRLFGQPDTFTGFLVGAFGAGAVVAAFAGYRTARSVLSCDDRNAGSSRRWHGNLCRVRERARCADGALRGRLWLPCVGHGGHQPVATCCGGIPSRGV